MSCLFFFLYTTKKKHIFRHWHLKYNLRYFCLKVNFNFGVVQVAKNEWETLRMLSVPPSLAESSVLSLDYVPYMEQQFIWRDVLWCYSLSPTSRNKSGTELLQITIYVDLCVHVANFSFCNYIECVTPVPIFVIFLFRKKIYCS